MCRDGEANYGDVCVCVGRGGYPEVDTLYYFNYSDNPCMYPGVVAIISIIVGGL